MGFGREFDTGKGSRFSGGELTSAVREIDAGMLIHAITDFPWIPSPCITLIISPVVFFKANRADRNEVSKILPFFGGIEFFSSVVGIEEGFKIISVGIMDVCPFTCAPGIGKFITVIRDVHGIGDSHLFEVALTFGGISFIFGFGQSRQEHAGENGNYGNYHQKFNQRERPDTRSLLSDHDSQP